MSKFEKYNKITTPYRGGSGQLDHYGYFFGHGYGYGREFGHSLGHGSLPVTIGTGHGRSPEVEKYPWVLIQYFE